MPDDDFISRKAAIEVIQQPGARKQSYEIMCAVHNLQALYPAANVVRIVRCGDCMFYGNTRPRICDVREIRMFSHEFCSSGKRREL